MSKEEIIYNAKLAEHSERYADMIVYMKQLIDETNGDLNNEERTLLSVAYKQAVGERRNAWRILGSYEEKQKSRGSEHLSASVQRMSFSFFTSSFIVSCWTKTSFFLWPSFPISCSIIFI